MIKTLFHIAMTISLTLFISCAKDDTVASPSYISDNKYFSDGDIEVVFENDKSNGINVIFMGDVYFQNHLEASDGIYRKHALNTISYLFNSTPFSQYKKHFNAYIIYAESKLFVSEDKKNEVKTPFGSSVSPDGLPSISNWRAIDGYVSKLTGKPRGEKDLILISIKSHSGGGTAWLNNNVAIFGAEDHRVMLHEVGHAFANLGDEYANESYQPIILQEVANLDSTNNPDLIKWKHFLGLSDYIEVGAYEGGNYRESGFWRPEEQSVMGWGSYFNAPSREAIVKKIMELKKLEYNFKEFLKIDKSNDNSSKKTDSDLENKNSIELKCGVNLQSQ
ncbi:M64 family metallopeptidase [Muricauda oceani]|uniref:IgA Peptidase M64 n=1 Tax=Flagellimonas oceani TaxID=2698672 RepID=A0A6G7IYT5_9FLAO|nr:M64 family metallopeptidase [Allomuricauda oceani]MBW8244596.1 M64 family metallopeptidase [Allomuricauda oceani]QII43773.1 hypothetical protein GVT53_03470 [Allomuricauda oceani]